jgi:hypothetical protein
MTDYTNRVLRHRTTGQVAVVSGQSWNILGQMVLRLKHGDGTPERITLAAVEEAYQWLDGVTVVTPDLGPNVVRLVPRERAAASAPHDGGSAA